MRSENKYHVAKYPNEIIMIIKLLNIIFVLYIYYLFICLQEYFYKVFYH